MRHSSRSTMVIGFFLVFAFSVECAYIDPGTGSYFIQILIAVLAGGAFAVKIFWKKIVAFFRGERQKKVEPESRSETIGVTRSEASSATRSEREARSLERASGEDKHD